MISISSIGMGTKRAEYYCQYCQEAGHSPGYWLGLGAQALGLAGKRVHVQEMKRVLQAYHPDSVEISLAQNAGEKHRGGWDATWSADKSVSVLWSSADPALRTQIEQAHNQAVQAGLDFFQRYAGRVRTGAGGIHLEKADMVFAAFQHGTNRSLEPQLHTHTIIFNVGRSQKNFKWRGLDSLGLYQMKMTAGAVYRTQLAHELRKLGFRIKSDQGWCQIEGVPADVCMRQSSRSKAIEERLKFRGVDRRLASGRCKEVSSLDTRVAKHDLKSEHGLDFARWREENAQAGFSQEQIAKIRTPARVTSELDPKQAQRLIQKSLQTITNQQSTFEAFELVQALTKEALGVCDMAEVYKLFHQALRSGEVLFLGEQGSARQYTTREMYEIERELVSITQRRLGESQHDLAPKTVSDAVNARQSQMRKAGKKLNCDQVRCIETVTQDGNGVSFITGVAGAGKTTTSRVIRDAYEASQFRVFGVAPTNKAAQGLAHDLGIETQSIHQFLMDAKNGKTRLDRRSVVFIDEGAMVDSKTTLLLNHVLAKSRSKAIYLGDPKQIQPIAAGQPFGTQYRMAGGGELGSVTRQYDSEEAQAILHVRNGNSHQCLAYLRTKNRVHLVEDRNAIYDLVVKRWEAFFTKNTDATSLIVTSRNATADVINRNVHERLKDLGILSRTRQVQTRTGELEVGVGERILFTANLKKQRIHRSQLATVTSISQHKIEVINDSGTTLSFDPRVFSAFRYGYAMTANRSQGATVDRSFVVCDGPFMDRERFYVALSRGRGGNEVFADKDVLGELSDHEWQKIQALPERKREAAEERAYLKYLGNQVNRSGQKQTSQDFEPKIKLMGGASVSRSRAALNASWASLQRGLEQAQEESQGYARNVSEKNSLSLLERVRARLSV